MVAMTVAVMTRNLLIWLRRVSKRPMLPALTLLYVTTIRTARWNSSIVSMPDIPSLMVQTRIPSGRISGNYLPSPVP